MLDRLALKPASRRAPGPGEVEVQVAAAGVNFRDVMKALGIYPMQPGDVPWLGDEFAGRVLAVGEGVDLEIGQEVFGVAPAAFGSVISTRADYVLPKPATLAPEDAATLPVVFTTALYALTRLAHLGPGERILIHAAAGGVGQAAIQIARSIGAEIFATASESKRDFVRSLGVEHVYDSRTLDFADQIREDTGGRGVDVVLNHLAGDFIPASMSVLAPYGRFIEIGKRDIFANSKIGLWPFRNNLSFFAVDMDRLGRDRPAIYRDLLREVFEGFQAGIYTPLSRTVYPIQNAVSAFRFLAQGRHIGKVVLAFDSENVEQAEEGFGFRGDATYLITGGLRGLGSRVAEWMTLRGARNLVLLGRDPTSDAAQETARRIAAVGGRATLLSADVGVREQVDAVLAQIDASLPPLRGIVHAAGILADGILSNLDDAQFSSVFGPKAVGALNLHRATLDRDLDFFISFSSTSSLMGNPGQANYAAANAFLDRLAWLRRSQGRAAQTIHWGPWSEIGMSATAQGQRSFEFGVGTISPARGIEALGVVAGEDLPEIAVMPMDWARFISRLPSARTDPFLAVIRESVQLESDGGAVTGVLRETLLAAPAEERVPLVEQFVQAELAKVLELDPEALPLDQPLNTVGLDSLMALELKNRVEVGIAINLPIVSLIQGPTISQLSAEIVSRLDAPPGDEPDPMSFPTPTGTASAGAAAAGEMAGATAATALTSAADGASGQSA
jgi:NADPH:quinone reductase-like Zn-dependent oxidoreductase/NAD(P)-dependent dehydrogenase (short-subunit alcohol dehydrogenase family)